MTRRLYNIAVVASLVLFVVVMGCWVHSGFYFTTMTLSNILNDHGVAIAQRSGIVAGGVITQNHIMNEGVEFMRQRQFSMIPPSYVPDTIWFGLGYVWGNTHYAVYIPHWILAIFTLILPVVWLIRRRRKPDPDAVPCPKCGYDLRESRDACPECGHTIPKPG